MLWTKEQDVQMVALSDEGYSGSQIGALIGRTKNSVISRLNRLGKNKGKLLGPRKKKELPTSENTNVVVVSAPYSPPIFGSKELAGAWATATFSEQEVQPTKAYEAYTIMDLKQKMCRWFANGYYCGRPIKSGSYCKTHGKLVYVPNSKR